MICIRQILLALERNQYFISKRFAGHSKWANIKHTKMANDKAKAKLFMKFSHRIKIAILEKGDPDPVSNYILAQIIDQAKKQSMPLATIQNAIKTAQSDKTKIEQCFFEIRGPKGCFIIASVFTENRKKTKDTISTILRKNNASWTDNIARTLFTHKAIIEAEPPEGTKGMDQMLDFAIESGAEDVTETDSNAYMFYCDPNNLNQVRNKLEDLKFNIVNADDYLIPNSPVALNDSDLEAVGKLCDKLEEHPDVNKLYDNIA